MSEIVPRPHQKEFIALMREKVKEIRDRGEKTAARIICSMPTGAGKTFLAAFMIASALKKGMTVMFIVDRIVLVNQTIRTLKQLGIEADIMRANIKWSKEAPVIVASAQTLEKRVAPARHLVFVDECHTIRKGTMDYISTLPRNSVVVGLSATPFARELAEHWHGIVNVTTTDKLIADGTLSPIEALTSVPLIDMKGVKGTGKGGEWSDKQCETAAMGIIGNIPQIWREESLKHFGKIAKTICFVPSVDYGKWLVKEFEKLDGITARTVTYADRAFERAERIEAFENGEIDVLVSVEALCKGFDVPDIEIEIDARPRKKSLEGFIQGVGRAMRGCPGKEKALLLDFAGNWVRFHNELKSFFQFGIHHFGQYSAPPRQSREASGPKPYECEHCLSWLPQQPKSGKCPICGGEIDKPDTEWEFIDGMMVEAGAEEGEAEAIDLWPHLCAWCLVWYIRKEKAVDFNVDILPQMLELKKRSVKWAKAQHKEITGSWPKWGREFEEPEDGKINPFVDKMLRLRMQKHGAKVAVEKKYGKRKSKRWEPEDKYDTSEVNF